MTNVAARPMPTPDLAGLLSKPARPARASDPIGPPTSSKTTDPETTAVEPAEPSRAEPKPESTLTPTGIAGPPRPRSVSTSAVTEPAGSTGRQYLRSIALYLPRSMHKRVAEQASARGTTRTALILTAVNRTHSRLAPAFASEERAGGGDLFDIPQQKTVKEPSVQTTIRVTDRQIAAIDELVTQNATNRSRLIATALTLYLPA